MNEADYLRLLTRQAEQANDFLSNARKWDRERWVCQRFLEALNVPYRQEDFAAPGEQPPDVLFKGAGFEVFFVQMCIRDRASAVASRLITRATIASTATDSSSSSFCTRLRLSKDTVSRVGTDLPD